MNTVRRGFFILASFITLISSPIFYTEAVYSPEADCSDGCDDAGEYVCGSSYGADDMCCTGTGCPSYACTKDGYDSYNCKETWTCCPSSTGCISFLCNKIYLKYVETGTCTSCGSQEEECNTSSPAQVNLSAPINGAVLVNYPTVTLSWSALPGWGENCDGNSTKKYTAQVDSGSGWVDICTVDSPTTSCTFNTDTASNKTYKWRVKASNGAETSTSAEWTFTNNVGTNVTVTVEETPYDTEACYGSITRVMSGVTVYISTSSDSYFGVTGSDGKFTTFVKYANPAEMKFCSSYSEAMCQAYSIRCPSASSGCTTVAQDTGVVAQSVVLQLAKSVKDPWVAVADGDAAAGRFLSIGPCLTGEVGGGFFGGMLNLFQLGSPANIYAISNQSSSLSGDIAEGAGGGYVQMVGAQDPVMEKFEVKASSVSKTSVTIPPNLRQGIYKMSVSDFNYIAQFPITYNFAYPGCSFFPTKTKYTYSTCSPGDKCYDTNYPPTYCKPLCVSYDFICPVGTYYTHDYTPRVAIFYIEGTPADTLTISAPITKGVSGYQGGHLLLVTKAKIAISESLGYTSGIGTFGIETTPQIDAVLISSTGVKVSEISDVAPMNPIVFSGIISSLKSGDAASKGLSLIRDLGINNNLYPGVVVKYPPTLLRDINSYIKYWANLGYETGLETFDVQYEFENVQEKIN